MGLSALLKKMAGKKDQVYCVAKLGNLGGYRIVSASHLTNRYKVISQHTTKKEAEKAVKKLLKA